jgi:hypothetical protein
MASEELLFRDSILPSQIIKEPIVLSKIQPDYIHEFIEPFKKILPKDFKEEFRLPVKIRSNGTDKYNPILRLARPEEAKIIANIVKDDYEGTYPYKEMEDAEEIKRRILKGKHKFIVFLTEEREIIGSTCFVLDLKQKKGYLRSLVIKREWLGMIDTSKAYITACLMVMNHYRNSILIWWGEARTANAKSQYINRQCAVRPIAWLPNKDIFFNKIESDLMMIAYEKHLLSNLRRNDPPQIISSVLGSYIYADTQYGLGEYELCEPIVNINKKKVSKLKKKIKWKISQDKFGYIKIVFSLAKKNSYFKFLYTPRVKNFEKTRYHVNNLEELYLFLKFFRAMIKFLQIRYAEAYLSSYQPSHQKLFKDFGFCPRGYIPGLKFNSNNEYYEDCILFNWYSIEKTNSFELISEGELLVDLLGY